MVWPHFTSLISTLGIGGGWIAMPHLYNLHSNGSWLSHYFFLHVPKLSNAWETSWFSGHPPSPLHHSCCTTSLIECLYNCFIDIPLETRFSFSSCYWVHHSFFLAFASLVPYWYNDIDLVFRCETLQWYFGKSQVYELARYNYDRNRCWITG